MMDLDRSKSLLEPGDRFRFRGLRRSRHDTPDNGKDETTIEVLEIAVTGEVVVEVFQHNKNPIPRTGYRVPLDLADRLIEQNIWQYLEGGS